MMAESMWGVSQRYTAVMALVDDDSVEQDAVNAALMDVMDDVKSKGENGINYLHSLDENIEGAKARKKHIDDYIKTLEKRKKRVLNAYISAMQNMGMKSIVTSSGELKLKANPPAVVIEDMAKIPAKYQKQKIEISVDKMAIKAAIKAGETVEGAKLVQGTGLSY